MTVNNMILLLNVRDFVIEGISFEHQRFWAINLIYSEYGRLSNLHFYCEAENPNLDGIDLRYGCHDIIIENITGQSGDDLIAISAIGAAAFDSERMRAFSFSIPGASRDIHDITIRNVIGTSVDCAVIAFRASDGHRLYNVTIDNVHDVDNGATEAGKRFPEYPKATIDMDIRRKREGNHPYALLRIGQNGFYRERANILGEVYGITATDLYSRGGVAIMVNASLKDSYFSNIHAENDVDYIVTTKSGRVKQKYGADMQNVVFENIFYDNTDNDYATAFYFDHNEEVYTLDNVIINRAFLGNCEKIFNMNQNGNVIFRDLYGKHVKEQSGEIIRRDL
jgi:polygalacturonase